MRQYAHTEVVDQTRRVRCVRLGSMLLNGANPAHRVDETNQHDLFRSGGRQMFEQMKLHRFLSTKIMTTIIRLSLIGMIVASFVGVGILSAQSSLVSKARPTARAKTTGDARNAAKPTIVLVHGAFADATSWQHVIPILERDGYNVIAVQNALASLAGDVETTKRVIDAQTGPVVVVGHSYGGAVITGAAAENANVM